MGSPLPDRESQASEVIERLATVYPDADISLEFSTRFELLVAVILSAQCTDTRVNAETPALFERYPSPEAFATADVEAIAKAIGSITYPNQKAGYLHDAATKIVEEHDDEVPDTMADLTNLPGVGRKTANVVLQHGHDVVEGIVVDTHVQRLSRRLGLTTAERPNAIEEDLQAIVPRERWQEFTHLLINHGRATCTAQNPDCGTCVLEDICPSSRESSDVDLASGEAW